MAFLGNRITNKKFLIVLACLCFMCLHIPRLISGINKFHDISIRYKTNTQSEQFNNIDYWNISNNLTQEVIQELYVKHQHSRKDSRYSKLLSGLSALVLKRITAAQNPVDCKTANKLVYKVSPAGYGSTVELLATALLEAHSIGRVLIVKSKGWVYCSDGLEKYHLPLSENCTDVNLGGDSGSVVRYNGYDLPDEKVLYLGQYYPQKYSAPSGVPRDIAALIAVCHSRPQVWWFAQFVKYVSRLQPSVQTTIGEKVQELSEQAFHGFVVGIHIRRKDKVTVESRFTPVENYFHQAEQIFISEEVRTGKKLPRKVYLATDDKKVLIEAKRLYPDYKFIHLSMHQGSRTKPYKEDDLIEIILDLTFLIKSNFTVCTLSSNICRRVYEWRQINDQGNPDHIDRVRSLDIEYGKRYLQEHRVAIVSNQIDNRMDKKSLSFVKGDVITIIFEVKKAPPLGMGYGYCLRTNKYGLYIISKTMFKMEIAEFPIYNLSANHLYDEFFYPSNY